MQTFARERPENFCDVRFLGKSIVAKWPSDFSVVIGHGFSRLTGQRLSLMRP
jgi:hypothetical protein